MVRLQLTLFFSFLLVFSSALYGAVETPFEGELVVTYEIENGEFKELVPFYSYIDNVNDDDFTLTFRADNSELGYDQESGELLLTIEDHTPIVLAQAELVADGDRLFPNVRLSGAVKVNSISKKEGRRYKVTVCDALHIPLPFFPACRRVKVRAFAEITEVETALGEKFCSKYIRDYRSEMNSDDAPSALKFYHGPCQKSYLTDEPFIYRKPRR